MKKIGLLLSSNPSGGGLHQYSESILEAVASLPSDQFSVTIGYTSLGWEKHLKARNLRSFPVPIGFWGRICGVLWTQANFPMGLWRKITPHVHPLAKSLLRENCDLWIFPCQESWSYQVPVPALVTIFDLMHRYERRFPEVSGWGEFHVRERNYRNICAWSRGVLVDSETGRHHVMESYGLSRDRIHVLPYTIPKYLLEGTPSPDFDRRYQIPPKYIFYPAQFWKHKNHENLLRALAILKLEFSDLRLLLAGSRKNASSQSERIIAKLDLSRNVVFLGYVPDHDMAEFYRRARALVMPTFFGPTNIPPLEAFHLGCPVAISRIYGIPEQVGDAALLFDPESVEEIAACLRSLWTDDQLCASLIENGRRLSSKWGQPHFNERLAAIIEQITGSLK